MTSSNNPINNCKEDLTTLIRHLETLEKYDKEKKKNLPQQVKSWTQETVVPLAKRVFSDGVRHTDITKELESCIDGFNEFNENVYTYTDDVHTSFHLLKERIQEVAALFPEFQSNSKEAALIPELQSKSKEAGAQSPLMNRINSLITQGSFFLRDDSGGIKINESGENLRNLELLRDTITMLCKQGCPYEALQLFKIFKSWEIDYREVINAFVAQDNLKGALELILKSKDNTHFFGYIYDTYKKIHPNRPDPAMILLQLILDCGGDPNMGIHWIAHSGIEAWKTPEAISILIGGGADPTVLKNGLAVDTFLYSKAKYTLMCAIQSEERRLNQAKELLISKKRTADVKETTALPKELNVIVSEYDAEDAEHLKDAVDKKELLAIYKELANKESTNKSTQST